jgi:hypothetical protein
MKGPLCDGYDLVQLAFERRRCWLLLLPHFQEQLRLSEDALASHAPGSAPGVVEQGGFARGPVFGGEDLRHALALRPVDARRGSEITHRDLRGDAAIANQLLHPVRQYVDQRQTARHPGRAAVETSSQILD